MASLGVAARVGVAADAAEPYAATSLAELFGALGGTPGPSPLIRLETPEVADNGAVVPITVSSALPGTREILLLVDVNPQPLALRFAVPAGTEPFVATRIRMAGSGTVYAAVQADDGFYAAARAVKVIAGGCN
jgi:sulfur-oxidizing protein SoxY